jgi:hypothetical protein
MKRLMTLTSAALVLGIFAVPTVAFAQAMVCHMEQQCRWVNFKRFAPTRRCAADLTWAVRLD